MVFFAVSTELTFPVTAIASPTFVSGEFFSKASELVAEIRNFTFIEEAGSTAVTST